MNESVTGCGHQGPSGMTFPDILADPLVRAVMVADHVDPDALRADLVRIAWGRGGRNGRVANSFRRDGLMRRRDIPAETMQS